MLTFISKCDIMNLWRYFPIQIYNREGPMRSVLEELWYGNICPNSGCREASKEAKQLMSYIADHHDNLQATLTDKQKAILEKFDDCYAELTDIYEREIFVYAFRLGARIAIEVMNFSVE